MEIYINAEITDILEPLCKKFYSECLDEDESYYQYFKEMNKEEKFNNYVYTIISDKKCFKSYYDLLIKKVNKKEVNEFFYNYLKMKQKSQKKIWSWNELMEFNIDPYCEDLEINTTSKYKFF
jgi:hypothetical protein